MATKTTKAKITGKSQYASRCVYKGARTRSKAETEIYRAHALEALRRIEQKRATRLQKQYA
jgi:hypothetical protein